MKEEKKHFWLYILRLEEGKYYVGITSRKNPNQRIEEHINGFYSAQWVKRYRPIKPLEIVDIGILTQYEAEELELERTLQLMKKYGTQNVRGGKLNYSGRYVKISSRFWRSEDFQIMLGVFIMLLTIIILSWS